MPCGQFPHAGRSAPLTFPLIVTEDQIVVDEAVADALARKALTPINSTLRSRADLNPLGIEFHHRLHDLSWEFVLEATVPLEEQVSTAIQGRFYVSPHYEEVGSDNETLEVSVVFKPTIRVTWDIAAMWLMVARITRQAPNNPIGRRILQRHLSAPPEKYQVTPASTKLPWRWIVGLAGILALGNYCGGAL